MITSRDRICKFIADKYNAIPEYLWTRFPDYAVFRRADNKKWFAVVMSVKKSKLGLNGEENADILNVKCDPFLVSLLVDKKGFLPAYHLNKKNWITILLDGSQKDISIEELIETSFQTTATHICKNKNA